MSSCGPILICPASVTTTWIFGSTISLPAYCSLENRGIPILVGSASSMERPARSNVRLASWTNPPPLESSSLVPMIQPCIELKSQPTETAILSHLAPGSELEWQSNDEKLNTRADASGLALVSSSLTGAVCRIDENRQKKGKDRHELNGIRKAWLDGFESFTHLPRHDDIRLEEMARVGARGRGRPPIFKARP